MKDKVNKKYQQQLTQVPSPQGGGKIIYVKEGLTAEHGQQLTQVPSPLRGEGRERVMIYVEGGLGNGRPHDLVLHHEELTDQ